MTTRIEASSGLFDRRARVAPLPARHDRDHPEVESLGQLIYLAALIAGMMLHLGGFNGRAAQPGWRHGR
jgi:hypothetical protein